MVLGRGVHGLEGVGAWSRRCVCAWSWGGGCMVLRVWVHGPGGVHGPGVGGCMVLRGWVHGPGGMHGPGGVCVMVLGWGVHGLEGVGAWSQQGA